jgi:hypothetical protein
MALVVFAVTTAAYQAAALAQLVPGLKAFPGAPDRLDGDLLRACVRDNFKQGKSASPSESSALVDEVQCTDEEGWGACHGRTHIRNCGSDNGMHSNQSLW